MNENQFTELREHLHKVLPDIEKFCISANYSFVNQQSLGRYPRIRVEKKGAINLWIDLWMELDEKGDRYESYFDAIPYELSAGASVVIPDMTKYGHRFQKSFVLFSNKPFKDVPMILVSEFNNADNILKGWNEAFLKREGKRIELG